MIVDFINEDLIERGGLSSTFSIKEETELSGDGAISSLSPRARHRCYECTTNVKTLEHRILATGTRTGRVQRDFNKYPTIQKKSFVILPQDSVDGYTVFYGSFASETMKKKAKEGREN